MCWPPTCISLHRVREWEYLYYSDTNVWVVVTSVMIMWKSGQAALGGPVWAGGWDRWLTDVPSNLSPPVNLWKPYKPDTWLLFEWKKFISFCASGFICISDWLVSLGTFLCTAAIAPCNKKIWNCTKQSDYIAAYQSLCATFWYTGRHVC